MFTPNHARAAHELLRVCRRGGKIGLANWTPRSFIGRLFAMVGRFVPPPPALVPPSKWGTEEHLDLLFREEALEIHTTPRDFVFRYRSPDHWIEVFRTWYGPVLKAFASLPNEGQRALEQELNELVKAFNTSGDSTMVVPSEYLEVVIVRK
jgi:hypothetical protein